MAKPCYALLSSGSYVALHHAHWLSVIFADGTPGFEVVCGAPGQDDLHYLYTWSAYPEPHETEIVWRDGTALTNNQVAAQEMLSRLMIHLAEDAGGLIVIDDLAADIVQEMGLEAMPQTPQEATTPG